MKSASEESRLQSPPTPHTINPTIKKRLVPDYSTYCIQKMLCLLHPLPFIYTRTLRSLSCARARLKKFECRYSVHFSLPPQPFFEKVARRQHELLRV